MKYQFLHNQKLRYLFVGGTAFAVEYSTFALLNAIGSNINVAQSLSFLCGLAVSFLGNRLFAFRNMTTHDYVHDTHKQSFYFLMLGITNLLVSNLLIAILAGSFLLHPLIAKIIVVALVAIWNFILFKKVIFKVAVEKE